MASCEDNFELTRFLYYLGNIYGPKLSMHTRKRHNYLGVDMEFSKDGTSIVLKITNLKNVTVGFPEEIRGKASSPTANHLFSVRDATKARALEEERALAFHHTMAPLLFMCTRAR